MEWNSDSNVTFLLLVFLQGSAATDQYGTEIIKILEDRWELLYGTYLTKM